MSGVIIVTVTSALVLLASALEFLVGFLMFWNFDGQLQIGNIKTVHHIAVARVALCVPSCRCLFWDPVHLIPTLLYSIVSRVLTLVLFTLHAMCDICTVLLGDAFTERDHILLGGVSSLHISMTSVAFLVSQEGLFNTLEHFQRLQDALGYCHSRRLILVLPVSWDHTQNVGRKVHVIEQLHDLSQFSCVIGVLKAGQ